jgi:hypothetical protein
MEINSGEAIKRFSMNVARSPSSGFRRILRARQTVSPDI